MTPINIESSIIKLGTEAVLRYRTISAATSDSELPEVFLGGFIASRLYDEIQCPIHIERPYMKMAAELGISTDGELKRRIELQRADMAVYQGGRPSHIVEFKIFDEGTGVDKIVDDLKKARELADRKPISILAFGIEDQKTRERAYFTAGLRRTAVVSRLALVLCLLFAERGQAGFRR